MDDFRQLTFAESQVQMALPDSARIVDVTPDGARVTRLVVLNVTEVELRSALAGFEVRDVPDLVGWLAVRVPGLSAGFDVALVTVGANVASLN